VALAHGRVGIDLVGDSIDGGDSEKHVRLLQFLLRRLETAAKT